MSVRACVRVCVYTYVSGSEAFSGTPAAEPWHEEHAVLDCVTGSHEAPH